MKIKYLLNILLVTLFVILISCNTTNPIDEDPPEPPEITPILNKILFASRRSGKEQLYTMNPDGSEKGLSQTFCDPALDEYKTLPNN